MISLYLFPLFVSLLVPLCCVIPYALAVYYDHVQPLFPYISDTGGSLPESSLFSQLLDITAIMISFTVYIRYKQIKLDYAHKNNNTSIINSKLLVKDINFYNKLCHYLGHLTAIGAIIIGNYRMTELIYGHAFGVLLAFPSAIVYQALMAMISLRLASNKREELLAKLGFCISLVSLITCSLCALFGFFSYIYGDNFFDNSFRLKWSREQSGYVYHCLSALFEWLLVLTMTPYFATMVPLFKKVRWSALHNRSLVDKSVPKAISILDSNANQNI